MEWKEEDKWTEYLIREDRVLGDITQVEIPISIDERGIKQQSGYSVEMEDGSIKQDPIGFGVTYYKSHPKWEDFNPLTNEEEIDIGLFYSSSLAKYKLMKVAN